MKTKTSHTAGPWKVSGCRMEYPHKHNGKTVLLPIIEHGDENTTCPMIVDVKFTGSILEMEANARLIASAPDMLEALKDAENLLADIGENGLEDYKDLERTMKRLQLAIAKATGEGK